MITGHEEGLKIWWCKIEGTGFNSIRLMSVGLGAIHKRRLLRGEGGGPPSKPIYYISLYRNLSQKGEGGGHKFGKMG